MEDIQSIRIDSHKLHFHPARVADWLAGKEIFPIYVEIGPSGACNNRCCFCAFDYLGYKQRFINKDFLLRTLREMAQNEVKSVMFAGEGEPYLHPDIRVFLDCGYKAGLDMALSTNGILWTPENSTQSLGILKWIRISLNAGTPDIYSIVHGTNPREFDKIVRNLENAVSIKRQNGFQCTIGVQCVLLPENKDDIVPLGHILKQAGVDYYTIKPFLKHPSSANDISSSMDNNDLIHLENKLKELETRDFHVAFRAHAMAKLEEKSRGYARCLGLPFFAKIISTGEVYSCGPFAGNPDFCYGNLNEQSFTDIWLGKRRRDIRKRIESELNAEHCMKNCRLDEINKYLWGLTHPDPHVNFI